MWCHVRANTPLLLTIALFAVPVSSLEQEPSLAEVLARSTDFVNALHEQLQSVVSEERYEQRWSSGADSRGGRGFRQRAHRRTLRSDYLLIQPDGSERYYGFRDVFEVDGRPVRDREERLTQLFLSDSASAEQQIRGILADSARHNIGEIDRNINTPTLALLFLRQSYKPRFEFEHVPHSSPPLGLDGPNTDDTVDLWVIEYAETWPTTVVSGRDGRNMPARGRYWIEPATGRVLVSDLMFESADFNATITVRYEANDTMGHFVPVEMRERYGTRSGSRVDGTATYTRFRRFQVQVDESTPFRN